MAVLTEDEREALGLVLDYLWDDEREHYEDGQARGLRGTSHIFLALRTLRDLYLQESAEKLKEVI